MNTQIPTLTMKGEKLKTDRQFFTALACSQAEIGPGATLSNKRGSHSPPLTRGCCCQGHTTQRLSITPFPPRPSYMLSPPRRCCQIILLRSHLQGRHGDCTASTEPITKSAVFYFITHKNHQQVSEYCWLMFLSPWHLCFFSVPLHLSNARAVTWKYTE